MYHNVDRKCMGAINHIAQYVKANYKRGVDYRTNKKGQLTYLSVPVAIETLMKVGGPKEKAYAVLMEESQRLASEEEERERVFELDQQFAMTALD